MSLQGPNQTEFHAFTLIEVLLAVSIFAVVLAAINGVFYAALRLRNKTHELVERSLPVQQGLDIIERDLQNIAPPGGKLSGQLQTGVSSTTTMEPLASPEFYTCNGRVSDAAPWGDIQKVAYSLRNSTNRSDALGRDLIRIVTRNLLGQTDYQTEAQWLMGDVSQIQFLFYDGTQWRNAWDTTTESNALPRAIKVQIDLATDQSASLRTRAPMELVVPILVQALTNSTTNATSSGSTSASGGKTTGGGR